MKGLFKDLRGIDFLRETDSKVASWQVSRNVSLSGLIEPQGFFLTKAQSRGEEDTERKAKRSNAQSANRFEDWVTRRSAQAALPLHEPSPQVSLLLGGSCLASLRLCEKNNDSGN